MKYLLLIYSNARTWGHPIYLRTDEALAMSETERDTMAKEDEQRVADLFESGEIVTAGALAHPSTARTVQVRDQHPVVTDGPYVESKEQMAGYFVLDCATQERAEEIAASFPDARFGPVELRPLSG